MRIIRRQINEMIQTSNGRISNTKVWAFIACAVATWIMIYMTLKDKMSWEMFIAYLVSVGGFSQLSKLMAYRYGGSATPTESDVPKVPPIDTVTKCANCPSPEESPTATPTVTVKISSKKEDEGSD